MRAATPAAFGEDIEVPWSQPKAWPCDVKQAELKSDEVKGSLQMSPFSERAPKVPQPP
jgi:hypothetical protein